MNKLFSFLKRIRLFQALTVFLAGILVFVTTACGNPSGVQAKTLDKNPRPEVPGGAVTSPYEGGMNDFSDVDPRADSTAASAKAQDLINRAEHNINERTGNPAEAIKRAFSDAPDSPQNAKQAAGNVGDKAKSAAEDFAQGTQRGIENLKQNTQSASRGIPNTFENAKQNAQNTASDAAKAGEKLKGNFQAAGEGVVDSAKANADKASNTLKSKADQALNNTQRAFGNNAEDID